MYANFGRAYHIAGSLDFDYVAFPHCHWVWSVPKMLRLHFMYHRKFLPKLCRCTCPLKPNTGDSTCCEYIIFMNIFMFGGCSWD